ncbi:MAG: alpha/beta hydrolase [Brevundimonas sp.]
MLSALAFAALIQSAPVSEDIFILAEPAPLHGTLLTPAETRAAAIIVPGSGPTDRNGVAAIINLRAAPYRMLAEALAERGVATLRIDKRGIGASGAAMADQTNLRFDHYVSDVRDWAADLAVRTGQDCVWIIGHSEGGLVALEAAAGNNAICGLVLISTPGRQPGVSLREQLEAGIPPGDLQDEALQMVESLENGQTATPPAALTALFHPSVQPYLISYLTRDPARFIADYDQPTLIVHGETDLQVVESDADGLAAAQPGASRIDIPGMNHVMKAAPEDRAGNIAVYADPDAPLAEGLADAVAAFIVEN